MSLPCFHQRYHLGNVDAFAVTCGFLRSHAVLMQILTLMNLSFPYLNERTVQLMKVALTLLVRNSWFSCKKAMVRVLDSQNHE